MGPDDRDWQNPLFPPGTPAPRPDPRAGGGANPPVRHVPDGDDLGETLDLPPEAYLPGNAPHLPPRRPPSSRGRRGLVAISVVLLLAIASGGAFAYTHRAPTRQGPPPGSPQAAVDAYLAAYTGGRFQAMYALTSTASRQRFSNPQILRPSYPNAPHYASAEGYIISRTAGILQEAQVCFAQAPASPTASASANANGANATATPTTPSYSCQITANPGTLTQPTSATASVPVRVEMQSARAGDITQDITIPMVRENGQWRIQWSPGLIFSHLDDPVYDPLYQRLVRLTETVGQRGTIYDAAGQPIATNGPSGQRVYPYGAALAAVTGWVSVVQPSDFAHDTQHYYEQGDLVGHAGLEQWDEQYLRPVKGGTLAIYDVNADGSLGQAAYVIATRVAANGDDIHTTISLPDTLAAYTSLTQHTSGQGAGAFAVDPATGDVMVLTSYPACDPTAIAAGNSACLGGPGNPQLDYALQSAQPIGSIFKMVTLAAALTHGIAATQTFTCTGTYQVPGENHLRYDDSPHGHGTLTAPQALAPSCDVIFWMVGVQLGGEDPTILPTMARAFGYGSVTGIIGVPQGVETAGLVPDPTWIQQNRNANWSPSDSANLAIGQGFFEATPAQVAMATAAIGNNGVRMAPRLVTAITAPDGSTVASFATKQVGTLPLTQQQLQIIQTAMVSTTTLPSATSWDTFHTFPIVIAGKTGTAQSNEQAPDAWFTDYAPAPPLSGPPVTPAIAMAVEVEYSGPGDGYAAPVCKAILAAQFHVANT